MRRKIKTSQNSKVGHGNFGKPKQRQLLHIPAKFAK